MPRIRKKTSNRGTTTNRKKITQKARETRKKRAKAAKTNPQWKSKTPKDPGIPNEFPYKDQILAEVQEQRRLAIEEKQRRKDSKKASKLTIPTDNPEAANDAELKDFDGVASIAAKSLRNVKLTRMASKPPQAEAEVEVEDEELAPALFNSELTNLKTVLDRADVVLEVLDCRDPLSFRSSKIEDLAPKRTVFVLNKIDLCPREAVSGWAAHLRTTNPTVLFRSASAFVPSEVELKKQATKGKGKAAVDNATGVDALLKVLADFTAEKDDEPLTVAVIGFTNVGKSSLINSIARKAVLPTYVLESMTKRATTTVLPQEITVELEGKKIKLVDTPGLTWESSELTDANRARDILLRNRGRIDRLKEPMAPVIHIVSRANNEDLMVHYSLPAFSQGDVDAFLPGVARSKQLIKRRGAIDLVASCRVVLRDWSSGALKWYTAPPSGVKEADADKDVLASLPTRRELRKRGGLLKVAPGVVDTRLPAFEEPYTVVSGRDDDEEDEDEDEEGEELESDDDDEVDNDEEDDEEEEEEEEAAPPPPPQKRKRAKEAPLPASKKVAFSAPKPTAKRVEKDKSVRKVANAPSKSKAKPAKVATADGGEAYDFGKFF